MSLASFWLLLILSTTALAAQTRQPPSLAATGGFRGVYPVRTGLSDADLVAVARLAEYHTLESAAADLNGVIRLPKRVVMTFARCDKATATYNPSTRRIVICMGFVNTLAAIHEGYAAYYAELNAKTGRIFHEAIWRSTSNNIRFVLFHEAAHAVIHLLDLPVTGGSENAADQLAFFLLVEGRERDWGQALFILMQAQLLSEMAQSEVFNSRTAGNLHSMSKQRSLNLVCWIYGREMVAGNAQLLKTTGEPGAFYTVIAQHAEELPSERRKQCSFEYAQLRRNWVRLLGQSLVPTR